jgi:predicted HAD superfamily Cof-like phosphohydrolase/DNA-binding XRE family transcriptional regulator
MIRRTARDILTENLEEARAVLGREPNAHAYAWGTLSTAVTLALEQMHDHVPEGGRMRGADLRAFRTEEQLTQVEFAEFIGVTGNTLARWERDEAPVPHYVWRICLQQRQLTALRRTLAEQHDEGQMVRAFHRASRTLPVRSVPQVPSDDEVRFRARLEAEEFIERLEATFNDPTLIDLLREQLRLFINSAAIDIDLPALADAWADLRYIIFGSEATFGVDGNAVFRVVHEANMKKFSEGGFVREDGKVMKPPGWKPPDIAAELERQRKAG